MKGRVLVTLLIALNSTSATFDVEALKAKAATNIQTLTEVAATNLHSFTDKASEKLHDLHEKASTKLQELTENASNNLHDIAENIDLEKLKQLDFLHLLPKFQDKVNHKIMLKKNIINSVKNKIVHKKNVISGVKGLHIKGEDLRLAFEGKYPWPVVTRRIEYIYE